MPVRVSCPYCNAGFALPEAPPAGRADCPRCGERFPVRAGDPGGPVPPPVAATLPPEPTRTKTPWLVPALVLVLVAGGAAVWMLRDRSPAPVPVADPPPDAAAVPPLSLRGLGYLPPGANVAFAVRPGPLLEYAARTGQDPVALLTRAGVPASALGALAQAGITLQAVDHLAGGAVVPDADGGELRFAVALVLRRPVADEDAFLKALKARKTGPDRYEVEAGGAPLKLARASANDWVFGWTERDADPTGGRELPAGLREAVAERVPADATAWVATDGGRWADKPAVKLAVGVAGRKELLPVLAGGRAAVAGLSPGDPPRLRLHVRTADAATGERLRAYFRSKAPGEVGGAGDWANLDAPFDPAAGLGPFRPLLDDAGK
ncbi:MAG: zinc-ribbon domain-containing protein [Gemmataceae bacterium]|nr:zinc-ribbon domain-containing protein [Gemmataceae bacterium]